MTEFEKYIQRYLDLIPSDDWLRELMISGEETLAIYRSISEDQGNYAYATEKWTMKELLQHLVDAERIFAYRALRFSRRDRTELPGWDEEQYGRTYSLNERPVLSLLGEFDAVRKSTVLFFEHLNTEQLAERGIANGYGISVETLGKLIVGHHIHHLNIIKERYLS